MKDWQLQLPFLKDASHPLTFLLFASLHPFFQVCESAKSEAIHSSGGAHLQVAGESLCRNGFNKFKTTPTPNKNGSYGIKGGVRMP